MRLYVIGVKIMTMSNIPKPEGGFYQVGDVLANAKESNDFYKALGGDIYAHATLVKYMEDGLLVSKLGVVTPENNMSTYPYAIKGFLPEHTATATTPNPPLTFRQAMGLEAVFVDIGKLAINDEQVVRVKRDGEASWDGGDALWIDLAVRRGNVYALDPATHPPTPREEG
jgi:hypothetical protein